MVERFYNLAHMPANVNGQWVRYSDYATLEAKLAEVTGERDSWRRVAERLEGEKQAAESRVKALEEALRAARATMRNCFGAIESDQIEDKDVHRQLIRGVKAADAALGAPALSPVEAGRAAEGGCDE